LSWQPSKNDGNSPLTAYQIEMKEDKARSWTKVTKVSPEITTYCAQKLKTKAEYVFRVMAVNAVGVSEPLTSSVIIPKSLHGKLQMNLSLIPLRCVLDLLNYFNYSYCL
jgi:hypothetical protein